MRRASRCLAVAAALAVAGAAAAAARSSDWIVNGGSSPALLVDAHGNAQVSWTSGGTRAYLVVPPTGRVYHARLPGPDTSKPVGAAGLPNALAVRRAANGTVYALQTWDVAGQPEALHFARWSGAPTQITLSLSGTRLTGTVSFHGKPVTGTSPTPSGTSVRIYVYLDCLGCAASPNGWSPLLGSGAARRRLLRGGAAARLDRPPVPGYGRRPEPRRRPRAGRGRLRGRLPALTFHPARSAYHDPYWPCGQRLRYRVSRSLPADREKAPWQPFQTPSSINP